MTASSRSVMERIVKLRAAAEAVGPTDHETRAWLERLEEVLTVLEGNLDGADQRWLTSTSLKRLSDLLDPLQSAMNEPSKLDLDVLSAATEHLIDFSGGWQVVWVDAVAAVARSRVGIDKEITELSTYLESSRGRAGQGKAQNRLSTSVDRVVSKTLSRRKSLNCRADVRLAAGVALVWSHLSVSV
jgi:hypothetical protein